MLNKLNNLHKVKVQTIAIPPPINPAKKFVKTCNKMFETKWPIKLQGVIMSEYFIVVFIKFMFKFGTAFCVFLVFSSVIAVMDKKKEIITELIPTNGVNTTKLKIKIAEPIM